MGARGPHPGSGNAGSGGFVPSLQGRGLAGLGRTFELELPNVLGGTYAAYLFHVGPQPIGVVVPTSGTELLARYVTQVFVDEGENIEATARRLDLDRRTVKRHVDADLAQRLRGGR